MGSRVFNFCIQDSPRRAHSIAAQGGINAAKNYQNDGDSCLSSVLRYWKVVTTVLVKLTFTVWLKYQTTSSTSAWHRVFLSLVNTVVHWLTVLSVVHRYLVHSTLKVRQVSSCLLGAYSALSRQVGVGTVKLYTRYEMLDVVLVDGRARGIIAKNLVTGKLERFAAHAVVIATGGYGNAYFLSTNAMGCNVTAAMSCYRKRSYVCKPAYVQIHPTCIPVHGDKQSKLTLMSESLRNDGRIWVPKKKLEDAKHCRLEQEGSDIPEEDRDYYLERRYPAFGNLVPRDVASRAAKERCDHGFGVNNTGLAYSSTSLKYRTSGYGRSSPALW